MARRQRPAKRIYLVFSLLLLPFLFSRVVEYFELFYAYLFIYLSLFICKLHAMSVEAHACKSESENRNDASYVVQRTCGVKVVHTKMRMHR